MCSFISVGFFSYSHMISVCVTVLITLATLLGVHDSTLSCHTLVLVTFNFYTPVTSCPHTDWLRFPFTNFTVYATLCSFHWQHFETSMIAHFPPAIPLFQLAFTHQAHPAPTETVFGLLLYISSSLPRWLYTELHRRAILRSLTPHTHSFAHDSKRIPHESFLDTPSFLSCRRASLLPAFLICDLMALQEFTDIDSYCYHSQWK